MTHSPFPSLGLDTAHAERVRRAARDAMNEKTKPVGSLGYLEELAERLAVIQDTIRPTVARGRVLVFAADHGVALDGVSAYPRVVTAEMLRNFARGGAAVCVLARSGGLEFEVVDVGVDGELADELDALAAASGTRVTHAKVARGTANLRQEPAMTPEHCLAAMEAGRAAVRRAAHDGVQMVGLGEMGIGNTTAAAALLCALTGATPDETVGRGTGVDDATLAHKRQVVAEAIRRHAPVVDEPLAALCAVGGFELAAIAGAVLEASHHRIAVVADGFISTVATLAAVRLVPETRRGVFVAHRSAEQGHALALAALDERPLLALDLRLGEGSGAALAMPLLRAAADVLRDMATFASAGVSRA